MGAESTDRTPGEGAAEDASGDYSYDLVHDAPPERGENHVPEVTGPGAKGAKSRAWELEGDYSYDLAHEVPPAGG